MKENCLANAQVGIGQTGKNRLQLLFTTLYRAHSKTNFELKPYDDNEMLLPSNNEINHMDANKEHGGSVCEMEINEERDRIVQLLMSSRYYID